ncbi:MAG: DUF4157 domain-containing protein [Cyanobacteria bacterium P01_D01_bin.36]
MTIKLRGLTVKTRLYDSKSAQDMSQVSAKKLLQTRPFQANTDKDQHKPQGQEDSEALSKGFDLTRPHSFLVEGGASSKLNQPLQAKLTIGKANDKYEQEADHVAQAVVQQLRAPSAASSSQQPLVEPQDKDALQRWGSLQRKTALDGGAASPSLESSIDRARSTGRPLDMKLQQQMGQAMGADFSDVKIHADHQADQLNRSIQAMAFTTGKDVFFRQDAYQPGSPEGQKLIAHELTHVVQQSAGNVRRSPQLQSEISTLDTHNQQRDQHFKNDRIAITAYSSSTSPIQRLVWTEADLKQEAGSPKADVTIDIPGIDTLTIKKMSQQYQKILSALSGYHAFISATPIKKDSQNRRSDAVAAGKWLATIEQECKEYLKNHKKDYLTATDKKAKADKKSKPLNDKYANAIKRNEAIEKIANTQIPEDQLALNNYASKKDNELNAFENLNLSSFVYVLTNGGLDKNALTGDPTLHPDSKGYAPPDSSGSFMTDEPSKTTVKDNSEQKSFAKAVLHSFYDDAQLVADQKNPLRKKVGEQPSIQELCKLGKKQDTRQNGSYTVNRGPNNPKVHTGIDPDHLFLDDGKPHIDEISQGRIGDCYFLAALGNIVRKDPDLLTQRLKIVGQDVEMTFYRKDLKTGYFLPQKVKVPKTLAQHKTSGLLGVNYRISATPRTCDWWVTVQEKKPLIVTSRRRRGETSNEGNMPQLPTTNTIITHRKDNHHAALWMPYLEKAFARFAQEYGKYGDKSTNNKGGYEEISGGHGQEVYSLFYGVNVSSASEAMAYKLEDNESDNLARNQGIITRLLQAADANLTNNKGDSERVDLTAIPSRSGHAGYAKKAIELFNNSQDSQQYMQGKLGDQAQAFTQALGTLKDELDKNIDFASDSQETFNDLAKAARAVVGTTVSWQDQLFDTDPKRPKLVRNMLEYMVNLVNLGTDSSKGQRNVYSRHAYTVYKAVFKDSGGTTLPLSHKTLSATDLKNIDPDKSIVELRNPHRANAPNLTGNAERGDKRGNFEMTLDEFLRHFDRLGIAIVAKG